MHLMTRSKWYKRIAYICVLEFAANKAVGVGFKDSQSAQPGFNQNDLLNDPSCKDITDDWLFEILPSICTVRGKDGIEVHTPEKEKMSEYRFVIKSEEFTKFASLIAVEKSHTTLRVALVALAAAVAIPPLVVYLMTSTVDLTKISISKEEIHKVVNAVRETPSTTLSSKSGCE